MINNFITIEGGDGAGKTTIQFLLKDKLEKLGYFVVSTREPGGINISEKIRDILLDPDHTQMDERTEALLYAASRRQHLVEKIIPALRDGKIVLCDRFIDSSLAYQGYARGIGMEEIYHLNRFAIEQYMPGLTLLLDIDPKKGLERILSNETREKNRLDLEALHFHQLVYEGYLLLSEKHPKRIKKIDATQQPDKVATDALEHIIKYLNDCNIERGQ